MVTAKRKISSHNCSSFSNFSHSLAPKYEELGQLYKGNKDYDSKVTIAKVDATANDVPDEIQGFPTLKMYAAGKKSEPIEYKGDRSIEDLAKFVKENGKYAIDVYAGKEDKKDDSDLPDAESMGKAAEAASKVAESVTDKVKSAASDATEAAKSAVKDTDTPSEGHDEL